MMTNILSKVGMVLAGALLAVASYGMISATVADAKGKPGADNGTIAAIAINDPQGRFTTLVEALECTGLAGLVDGNRQLTVFAPTNDAFAKLPFTIDQLCADPENLANILAYHVTPGVKTSKTVLNRSSLNMLNRQNTVINAEDDKINDSNIVIPDLRATNGVVHVIDAVMLP